MARTITIDDEQVVAAAENNKGTFTVYPTGVYNFTIFDAEEGTYKETSKNPGKEFYRIVLKFDGGTYDGKKLPSFQVPLFQNWAVSTDPKKAAKSPKGWPTNFAPFFTALGYDVKGKFAIPDPADLFGKRLSAKVTVEDDTYAFEQEKKIDPTAEQSDFKRNNVTKFGPPIEGLGEGSSEDEVAGGFNL